MPTTIVGGCDKTHAHLTIGFSRSITWHSGMGRIRIRIRTWHVYRQFSQCRHTSCAERTVAAAAIRVPEL